MPVEFIGMIATKDGSETRLGRGPVIDKDYTRRFVRAHEDAGFDRVLIGYASSHPDGTQVAAYAAAHSERLGFLVAHRPGFVAPTLAARQFTTLDQFSDGRIAVHIITGGHDAEQRRDGDYLSKDERYARTDEYLDIVRLAWTSDQPFSYHGQYYQVEDHQSGVKSAQEQRIRLYFGGSSEAAYRVGGKHADTYALWGEPLAETKQQIDSVNAAAQARPAAPTPPASASASGRSSARPRSSPGSARTASSRPPRRTSPPSAPSGAPSRSASAATSRRTSARSGCWPPPPRASCTTGRCGRRSPPRPAPAATRPRWSARRRRSPQALLDYVDIGVTTILIRGYDPYDDAIDYGRHAAAAGPRGGRPARRRAGGRGGRERERGGGAGVSARQRQLKLGAVSHGVGGPGSPYLWLDEDFPVDASVNINWYIELARRAEEAKFDLDLHRRQPVHHRRLAAALPQPARADHAAVGPRRQHHPHRPRRHHDHVLQRPVQPRPPPRLAGPDQRRPVRLERRHQRRRGRGGELLPRRALRLRHPLRPRPGVRPGRPGPVGLLRGRTRSRATAPPGPSSTRPGSTRSTTRASTSRSPARSTSPARRRASR